jgi:FKBP-type peptidyl-prolyl cis-trans isomerase
MVIKKKQMLLVGLMVASSCLAQGNTPASTASGDKAADKGVEVADNKKATDNKATDNKAAATPVAKAPVESTPEDNKKASYGIGTRIGGSLKAQNIPVNVDSLIDGLKDTLGGKNSKYNEKEIEEAMTKLQQTIEQGMAKAAEKNKTDGEAFLAKNKTDKSFKVTTSGLQYKVVTEGKGTAPKEDAKVKVHYRGTLLDGKEFDSSYKRNAPAEFTVNGVIPGWTEALKMMKPGAKYELVIPSELAYGARGTPGIPPNSVLKFTVELLEVLK